MGEMTRFGATPKEWARFDMGLGLTEDLLPVVSNPNAVISPTSKMKDKGKVPSLYRNGYVVGVTKWTQRHASDFDIETWSAQPDYGICIQTRSIRALDIDVTDEGKASEIALFICEHLGEVLPVRYRENSSKCLFAFRLEGEMPKRVIRVTEKTPEASAQLIEFLANGQQFVAAGTHSSGARIEWNWNGHSGFPVITPQQFESLWLALADAFGITPSTTGSLRKRGDYVPADDEMANKIHDLGLALGEGQDGQIFIDCPWKDNHSMDSGVTETAYFPRGTGGYELGHFKCMHAGCEHHKDADFEEQMGLREGMFDAVPPEYNLATGEEIQPLPKFHRIKKTGEAHASLHNLQLALDRPDVCGAIIRFDSFRDIEIIEFPGEKARPMTDADPVRIRKHLERNLMFKPVGRDIMRDALIEHAARHRFDSGIEWAKMVPEWDGIPRVGHFFAEYFGCEATPYATAVSKYLWTAMAGRLMVPGIKADMVPILQGEQGIMKSTAIAALSPQEDWFVELSLGDKEIELVRAMRGKVLAELGELRGLYAREMEAIKAFIVRRHDEIRPNFKERTVMLPRRVLFVGTTNHAEFLVDETGNRRFLPITVNRADIKRIRADRVQLWAEAITIFRASGIAWQDAEELMGEQHAKFMVHDSWEDDIATWLITPGMDGEKPAEKEFLKTNDILREALNIGAGTSTAQNEKRMARVMKGLGWISVRPRIEGKKARVFTKG